MRSTFKLAAVVAGLFGATNPALADDWTAVYGGIGIGAGAVVHELNLALPGLGGTNANFNGIGGEGVFFSATIGGDIQVAPRFVLGAFLDYDISGIKSDLSLTVPGLIAINGDVEVDNQLSIGLRAGWLPTGSKETLWYATAGYTRVEFEDASLSGSGAVAFNVSAPLPDFSGYFVGGGVETMLTDNISLRADYRFTQLSSESLVVVPGLLDFSIEPSLHTARIVASYRFPLRHAAIEEVDAYK